MVWWWALHWGICHQCLLSILDVSGSRFGSQGGYCWIWDFISHHGSTVMSNSGKSEMGIKEARLEKAAIVQGDRISLRKVGAGGWREEPVWEACGDTAERSWCHLDDEKGEPDRTVTVVRVSPGALEVAGLGAGLRWTQYWACWGPCGNVKGIT